MKHNGQPTGFSLIEVLIAIVVLSVGLLGLAGAQYQGASSTNDAYYRSQATMIGNELAERMHANQPAVDNNNYTPINIANAQTYIDTSPAPSNCDTTQKKTATSCDTTEMAFFDIYRAASDINQRLPGGTLNITCADSDTGDTDVCTNGSPHTIDVSWEGVKDGNIITQVVSIKVTP